MNAVIGSQSPSAGARAIRCLLAVRADVRHRPPSARCDVERPSPVLPDNGDGGGPGAASRPLVTFQRVAWATGSCTVGSRRSRRVLLEERIACRRVESEEGIGDPPEEWAR